MDQIKFRWYVEMYGESFGYENHIRWDDPIDLTNSGAAPVYNGKGFSQAAPSTNNDLGGTTEPIKDPNYIGYTSERFGEIKDSIKAEYGMAGTGHNTHPYMHYKMNNKNPGSIDPDDIILMRSSEMYLIEAEALVMQNDIPWCTSCITGARRCKGYCIRCYSIRYASRIDGSNQVSILC